jgi:hypothetical protein
VARTGRARGGHGRVGASVPIRRHSWAGLAPTARAAGRGRRVGSRWSPRRSP